MRGERLLANASAVAAAFALALAGLYPGNNPDTFGHLAQGRQIAELGHVPLLDTWSLLPGPARPWLNYEWLSDLGTWQLFSHFGYPAITVFKCLLLIITTLCVARTAEQWAGDRAMVLCSLAVVSAIPAIRVRLSDRPHVLGIALAAVSMLLLTRLAAFRSTDRRRAHLTVAALVLLQLLWVNAHGSHLLGIAFAGAFLVLGDGKTRPWYATVLGLELMVSCISPYGPAIWIDALDHVSDPRYRALVSEWAPWRDVDPAWLQIGPALQAATLTLLLPRILRISPSARANLALALLLGAACFRSIRFLAEFSLLTAPLLGAGLATLTRELALPRFGALTAALACVLALLVPMGCAHLPPYEGLGLRASFDGLPRAAGELLADHGRSPRVFATMQDSWYLMYAAPKSRFVLDGRVPFYGPDWVMRVGRARSSRDEFEALRRDVGFNTLLVRYASADEHQLAGFLDAGWSLVVIEDLHATFVRMGALDARGARDYPALVALRPSYDLDWILNAPSERVELMRGELARMSQLPSTDGYRAWVEGVLALAPLRRGDVHDGFRWPANERDWDTYRKAKPLIERAFEHAEVVPMVAALHAELAAVFCDFDAADKALELAMVDGPTREPLLAAQEVALRRGQRDAVRKVVLAARATAQGARDPWLAQLAGGLEVPPACPPQ